MQFLGGLLGTPDKINQKLQNEGTCWYQEQGASYLRARARARTHASCCSLGISRLRREAKSPGAEAHSVHELECTAQPAFSFLPGLMCLMLEDDGVWEPGP